MSGWLAHKSDSPNFSIKLHLKYVKIKHKGVFYNHFASSFLFSVKMLQGKPHLRKSVQKQSVHRTAEALMSYI